MVSLATDAAGALTSTAAQVAAAINAHPGAAAVLVAQTYRGNAGAGITQPRTKVNLSDFLTTAGERPRPARAVRVLGDADRQAAGRLARSACSSTASSTLASGRRR